MPQKRCTRAILVGVENFIQKKSKLKVWHSYRKNGLNHTSETKKRVFFQFCILRSVSHAVSTYCKLRSSLTKFPYTLLNNQLRQKYYWYGIYNYKPTCLPLSYIDVGPFREATKKVIFLVVWSLRPLPPPSALVQPLGTFFFFS